jgi:hypothetical protein
MGYFSWTTSDTKESIPVATSSDVTRTVFLLQPNGLPPIEEKQYAGFGDFGGIDAYIWLAKTNLNQKFLEGKTQDQIRNIGINIGITDFYYDISTGRNLCCNMHVEEEIRDLLGLIGFSNYGEILQDGKTPNDKIKNKEWASRPIRELMSTDFHPLKFSFDKTADYESLEEAKECEDQGYFYTEKQIKEIHKSIKNFADNKSKGEDSTLLFDKAQNEDATKAQKR